jgi:hypothetical protein
MRMLALKRAVINKSDVIEGQQYTHVRLPASRVHLHSWSVHVQADVPCTMFMITNHNYDVLPEAHFQHFELVTSRLQFVHTYSCDAYLEPMSDLRKVYQPALDPGKIYTSTHQLLDYIIITFSCPNIHLCVVLICMHMSKSPSWFQDLHPTYQPRPPKCGI